MKGGGIRSSQRCWWTARFTRVLRRREAAVLGAAAHQPLQLLDLGLQGRDPLGLSGNQSSDRAAAGIERDINNIQRHERKIPCTNQGSCDSADDPLNGTVAGGDTGEDRLRARL
jgi:hypothetical protein